MNILKVEKQNGNDIIVKVNKNIEIGSKKKVIISGPCSVEDYDTMRKITKQLKNLKVDILRAGAFKPRTSPYDFQGLGFDGLKILKELSYEFNIPVVSEIMDTRDVEKSLEYLNIIQIGSRNMYNYSLLKEIGKCNKPVILKRGLSATINEWLNSAEYILSGGNENVILCERGIRTFENATRNTLDLNAVAYIKEQYRLPIIADPSHGTGIRNLVVPMSKAALFSGSDGVIVESHTAPNSAVSDKDQTIDMEMLKEIVEFCHKAEELL